MKIIKPGTPLPTCVKWWHGLHIECPVCGQQHLLEPGDEQNQFYGRSDQAHIELMCANCFSQIKAQRILT